MPKNKRSLEDGQDYYEYLKDIGTSLIPIYGTYKETKNLINNPSLENNEEPEITLFSETDEKTGSSGSPEAGTRQ